MKVFELSQKKNKNGRRKFKIVLHEIFPDDCVDESIEAGTQFNKNGITWIQEYCEKALPSIEGASLRCEFLDEDRTEIYGHGYTGTADGDPIFENATQIGTFTKAYIEKVEDEEKGWITVCIGEGEIDALCYHNFVAKLDEGVFPYGSVEILHTDDNDAIVYKYGYKDEGRIPTEFVYSGYALLGIQPADDSAKLLELNEKKLKEVSVEMNEDQIKAVIAGTLEELNARESEINAIREECAAQVTEANEAATAANEAKEQAVSELAEAQKSVEEANAQIVALNERVDSLVKELNEAKTNEQLAALNSALAEYNAEEIEYAKDEIAAFKENPLEGEINVVTDAILRGIGKAAKADAAAKAAEQNAADNGDIFEEMHETNAEDIDESIF